MAKEESPLFVGVTNGNELRRSLLECSKDILESLKEHEGFKGLREEKIKMIYKLRDDIKELSKLINSLKVYLPTVRGAGAKNMQVKDIEMPRMVGVEKPKKNTEIEKLEEELSEIESKLNSLY